MIEKIYLVKDKILNKVNLFKEKIKNKTVKENISFFLYFFLKFCIYFHVFLFFSFFVVSLTLKVFNPSITPLMLYRAGFSSDKLHKPKFINCDSIPQDFKNLVLCVEDQNFYGHNGFDIHAITEAIRSKIKYGKFVHGGSTITQQVARTLFLTTHKNFLRKYLELIAAVEMDFILEKQRILELYLNYIEWGDNVYGLSDACQLHYKKTINELSKEEKVRLVTIIASPLKYDTNNFSRNRILKKRYQFLKRYGYRWQAK